MPRRAQALLAFLAPQNGRPITRELAADMLWTRSGSEQARHSLRQTLVTLRRVLGTEIIRTEAELVLVVPGAITVDVLDFDAGASAERLADLARCAELYQGELLEGLGSTASRFDEWLERERSRLVALAARVFRRLADGHSAAGDLDAALAAARRLIELDDLDEDAHRRVIRLLTQSGRRGEALRQFDSCADILKRELGIAPQPETTELARAIRNHGEGAEINARPGSPPAAKPGKKLRRPQASGLLPPVYAPPPRWGRIAAVLTAVCVVVAGVGFAINRPKPVSEAHTLLIVPFTNDSTHEVQDLPIAGISSLVAEELSETHSLRVSSYRADASGATKVHDHLAANPAVRYVVEGRVSSSSIFDIAIQLTDRNGTTLWSNRYARPRGGVLDIVDDITEHISRAVAADSALVRNSAAPVENAKQVARELLALSTFVRQDTSGSSAAALLQIARKAVAFDPQNPEALALLANGYLAHFTMSRERNDLAEADRYLERALALDPTSVLALWATSLLRRMQHRYADALVFCRRVIAINPHHAGGLREIGHDLIALHDPAEAVPWFRAAIEAAPNDPFVDVAYSGISEAEMEQEHGEKALAAAYDAVRHDHRGSLAMLRLAAMLEIADQHTEAQSVVVQFYQRHSEFPASDGRAFRLITGYSTHPQMLSDALHRLGVKGTEASDN